MMTELSIPDRRLQYRGLVRSKGCRRIKRGFHLEYADGWAEHIDGAEGQKGRCEASAGVTKYCPNSLPAVLTKPKPRLLTLGTINQVKTSTFFCDSCLQL